MSTNNALSLDKLKRAVQIHEQIESLQAELASLLGGGSSTGAKRGRKPGSKNVVTAGGDRVGNGSPLADKKSAKKKRVMSPEAREKIAAAQRKRWAKSKKADK